VTHFLAAADFYGHRPTVNINQHLSWDLYERAFWHFNLIIGASRIASPAYQIWPTKSSYNTKPGFSKETRTRLPI